MNCRAGLGIKIVVTKTVPPTLKITAKNKNLVYVYVQMSTTSKGNEPGMA